MSTTAANLAIDGPRVSGLVVVAVGVATVGWVASGLLAAIPAGFGLAAVAASDLSTHHFSLRTLGLASSLIVAALIVDSVVLGAWERLGVTVVGTAAVALLLVVAWLCTTGLAFGDVLLVPFAIAVPLYLSALAAAVIIGVALAAASVSIAVRVARLGAHRSRTVPLATALLVGWIAGMVVG